MTESQHLPQGDSPPPSPWRRLLTPRKLAIASAASAAAAAVALIFATQVAVQATSTPAPDAESTPIAVDSTDEGAPEKAESVAPPPVVAAASDNLSAAEVEYVRFLAAQTPEFAAGTDVFGQPGLQFLSTDVAEPQAYSDGERRLISLYYDYTANESVSMIVNATTDSVEKIDRASGSQPAPTDAETRVAWEMLLASEFAEPITAQFAALTGGSALTPDSAEIDLTAHSFTTDAASFGAASCGVDRCVQLLAQVDGGAFLTTTRVVINLSTKTVLPVS